MEKKAANMAAVKEAVNMVAVREAANTIRNTKITFPIKAVNAAYGYDVFNFKIDRQILFIGESFPVKCFRIHPTPLRLI